MNNTLQGKVLKLFITKDNKEKTRIQKDQVELDSNGITTDKFYAKDDQRAILITSLQSYNMAREEAIELEEGILGENILIDINPYHLNAGDRFNIGDITFEITQNCTLCKGLTTVNAKLPKLLKNDRGIFAKVVSEAGSISVGDSVEIPAS